MGGLGLRFPKQVDATLLQALFRSVAMIVPNLKFICSGLKGNGVKRIFFGLKGVCDLPVRIFECFIWMLCREFRSDCLQDPRNVI